MENKKTTPVSTVIFWILGIIFLAISAFMLYAGITYMRGYLASYEMSYADMWSNATQYLIEKFAPYLGIGVVCIGIGHAIKVAKNSSIANVEVPEIKVPDVKVPENLAKSEDVDGAMTKIAEVAQNLEEFKVVSDIKLEEMEKRQSFRIKENRDIINEEMVEHMAARAAAEDLIIRLLGSSIDEIKDISKFRREPDIQEPEEIVVEPEALEIEEQVAEPVEEPQEEEMEAEELQIEDASEDTEVPEISETPEADTNGEPDDAAESDDAGEEPKRHKVRRIRRFVK